MIKTIKTLSQWMGIQPAQHHAEQLVASLGGFVSLLAISGITYLTTGLQGTLAVVPAMGAATVLLFAIPNGPLSQPWALFVGNAVSAVIGVTSVMLIPNLIVSAAVAVGAAIGAMHLCRCMHPPGGATALAAVIGGASIHNLGYFYVFIPVLLNCLIIFITALAFNNIFGWRRYPLSLSQYRAVPVNANRNNTTISANHIEKALAKSNTLIDASPEVLLTIYQSAQAIQAQEISDKFDFETGGVYTNNRPGAEWSVRKIIDHAAHPIPANSLVIYKVINGAQKNTTNSCSRAEFAKWAKVKLKATSANE